MEPGQHSSRRWEDMKKLCKGEMPPLGQAQKPAQHKLAKLVLIKVTILVFVYIFAFVQGVFYWFLHKSVKVGKIPTKKNENSKLKLFC